MVDVELFALLETEALGRDTKGTFKSCLRYASLFDSSEFYRDGVLTDEGVLKGFYI